MEISTHRKLSILISLVALMGVGVSVLAYIESRRSRKMKDDLIAVDLEIKNLELAHKKNTVAG